MFKHNSLQLGLQSISGVDDYFHHDFQMGFQAYPHKYMGVNLGYTTSKGANTS
jgi:hypothetical protein